MIERLKVFPWNFFKFHQLVVLFIPFILFLASIVSLMTSLKQHSEQMRHYNAGHCNSNMRAHSTALKSLIIFVIFFTSYFLSVVIALSFSLFDKRPWFWIWEDVIYALVSIRSTLLMLSSPTVRKNLKVKCKVLETT
ncbi:Taste receptor type 2 member 16 [Tupaia chinensis]|uniref:Taste receptor type 2 member 16 n=2 Tax=Tupaia chinensis TaxID=246437 RepID=L9KRJ3_TUPCH|nr:Taste receptor type 2 member 16 [Tupaia chinensis]